jgi:hypothetical protein
MSQNQSYPIPQWTFDKHFRSADGIKEPQQRVETDKDVKEVGRKACLQVEGRTRKVEK